MHNVYNLFSKNSTTRSVCMYKEKEREKGRQEGGQEETVHKYRKILVGEFQGGIFFQLFCNV